MNEIINKYFKAKTSNKPIIFKGMYALMAFLFDPLIFTKSIKEIHLSKELHELLINYANSHSNVIFETIHNIYGTPLIINQSFPSTRLEIHYSSHIELITIEWE